MAMHNVEYCATASPSHMNDMVAKIQKGLAASKKGFAYLHIFSACPTGWSYGSNQSICVSRKAVQSNMFPLWEMEEGTFKLTFKNPKPLPISEFVKGIGKFKGLDENDIAAIQQMVDHRFDILKKLAGE
jgi:pyruvate/2-oxoacid:ferredoxin oxidoreductase beta subunit